MIPGSQPLFSIVVPTYQRPALLRSCLSSILSQTFADFEVIVGNNDPAAPLDQKTLGFSDSRIRVINRPQNIGAVANIVDLPREASGRYVTWLADDDLYLSQEFLQILSAGIEEHAYPKVLFTTYQQRSEPDSSVLTGAGKWRSLEPNQFLHECLQSNIEVIGNYGVWDRNFLSKIGGMKTLGTGFSPYSDTLLGLEAAYADRVLFIDSPLIFFRSHEESRSWTSEDLSAYATAQRDLIARFLSLTNTLSPSPFRDADFFSLMKKWCIGFFGAVATRSKNPQLSVWPGYFLWVWNVSQHLPPQLRMKLLARAGLEIFRILSRRLRRLIGSFQK